MGSRVELEFRRAADALIPAGSTVVAAVSGGSDSVALIHLLARAARPRRLRIVVAHLDHALRDDSADDLRFVVRLAGELGLSCVTDRREVARLRRGDESPEEAARRVRRAFLEQVRHEHGADRIACGHTLDDQAETVLMRLVRGAGARSLTGIRADGPGAWVRPLLGIEKRDLRRYLASRGLGHREDPTNGDLRFDRNRCRRVALPALERSLNPRAARHLVQAAERLREDAVLLDRMAESRLDSLTRGRRGGRVALHAPGLSAEPGPLARRMVRLALERAGADPRRLSSRHVEALLSLACGGRGRRLDLPTRVRAFRTRDLLVLQRGRAFL